MSNVKGKIVFITGGTSGYGYESAKQSVTILPLEKYVLFRKKKE